ncbi:transcription factor MYB14-like [Olea europaea var. sylvestris]|uniref:transcription factor MYB14-like n=1 Tax=Olea europaea var. sylvestris TaxID=158386 RepID=UPI000C1D8BE8|nr:transcription factor MYB14-like [Olea europaea var. sylvestris]
MVKPCYVDSNGLKKGAWSEEEDKKLREHIQSYGHSNWRLLPSYAGLARIGKSCRLRWVNYLKPGVKRGNYSKEEVDLIMEQHAKLGNKWSAIAEKLPGRTDNGIKNFWHAHVEKRFKRNVTRTSSLSEISQEESASKDVVVAQSSSLQELENSVPFLNNTNCAAHDTACWDSVEGTLWTEPSQPNYIESLRELNYDELLSPNPYILSPYYYLPKDSSNSSDAVAETQENLRIEPGGLFSSYFLFSDDTINLF